MQAFRLIFSNPWMKYLKTSENLNTALSKMVP